MKKLNLFGAAKNKVTDIIGGERETAAAIKQRFGILPPEANEVFPVAQVLNLLEDACMKGLEYIKPSPSCFVDPVNEHIANEQGYSLQKVLNEAHPVDNAFSFLKSAVELSAKEARKENMRRNSSNMDGINNVFNRGNHITCDSGSIKDIYSKIDFIFSNYCPSGRAKLVQDPVDEIYGFKGFPEEPKHTKGEWISLIKEATGIDSDSDMILLMVDPINDIAAGQFGHELPSSRAIPIIENKILQATYDYIYKLTPGSEEHSIKGKEIDQFRKDLQQRKDNLKETHK